MERIHNKRSNSANFDNTLSAWQAQVAKATNDPGFRQGLLNREGDLLPQFSSQYSTLSALPRRMRRALQRQWRKSLAGIALLLALGVQPALAATINVGGNCTLPRAITSANNNSSVGGCRKGAGADRIVLPRNSTHTLTSVRDTAFGGAYGLPAICSVITIEGNGSTIRRTSTAPNFSIFAVGGNGGLTLQRTRVSGAAGVGLKNIGSTTIAGSTISGNNFSGVINDYLRNNLGNFTVSAKSTPSLFYGFKRVSASVLML